MSSTTLQFGRLEIALRQRQVWVDGREVPLGGRAFDLLATLVEQRERVVGKDELLAAVWPRQAVEEANLAVQVHQLRHRLGLGGVITTVAGRGYQFTLAAGPSTPTAASQAPPTTVARAMPMLVGRDEALQQSLGALQPGRLLTLGGAAGIGKTALARAVARRHAGPVGWVELSGVAEGERVVPAALAQLGLAGSTGGLPTLHQLVHLVAGRYALLVLDNAEHVLPAVAALAKALAQGATGLACLVTSQAPLDLPHETVLPLGPLPCPAPGEASMAQVAASPAVALFMAHAQAVCPDFELSDANAGEVGALCRDLEGWPLALELAAVRVPHLGLDTLRGQHPERLHWLRRPGAAQGRHAALQAALQWSHDLLEPAEQQVFLCLGTFGGGFNAEAALAVAGPLLRPPGSNGEITPELTWAVLDALTALVHRSFVCAMRRPDGTMRYHLLETLRDFARHCARRQPALSLAAAAHHQRHYLALARAAASRIFSPRVAEVVAELDLEHENILAAITHCEGPGRSAASASAALQGVRAMMSYWHLRALWPLGHAYTTRALAAAGAQGLAPDAGVLVTSALLARRCGHNDLALLQAVQALHSARESHQVDGEVQAHRAFALACISLGRLDEAEAHAEQALALIEGRPFSADLCATVHALAGDVAQARGHHPQAVASYRQALQHHRAAGNPYGTSAAVHALATEAFRMHDAAALQRWIIEFHALARAEPCCRLVTEGIDLAAWLAAERREWERAVRWLRALESRFQALGLVTDADDRVSMDQVYADARLALGFEAHARVMTAPVDAWDGVVAEVRTWVQTLAPLTPPACDAAAPAGTHTKAHPQP